MGATDRINIIIEAKDKTSGGVGGAIGSMQKLGTVALAGAGVVGGALVGIGAKAVSLGANAEEMQAKFDTVFGEMGGQVTGTLDEVAKATGRNKFELRGLAAGYADLLKPMGFTTEEAAAMATEYTQLAVDVASFNNMPTEQVMNDIMSATTGSTEVLQKYGVMANQATIEQKAMEMGIIDNVSELDAQAKALAIQQLILEGTTDAHGDAERTAGSFTNQMRRLRAVVAENVTELGMKLLPIFTPLISKVGEFANKVLPLVIEFVGEAAEVVGRFTSKLQSGVSPITAIQGLIAELGFKFGLSAGQVRGLVEGFQSFVAKAQNLWSSLQRVLATVTQAVSNFVSWKDVLIGLGIAVATVVIPIIGSIVAAIAPVIAVFAAVVAASALLRNAWENNWGGIQEKTSAAITFIRNTLTNLADSIDLSAIVENVRSVVDRAQGVFLNIAAAVRGFIKAIQGGAAPIDAVSILIARVGRALGIAEGKVDSFRNIFRQAWNVIGAIVSSTISVIQPAIDNFVSNARGSLGGFEPALEALKGAWQALQPIVLTVLAVVGGAVVVAIGLIVGIINGLATAIGPAIHAFGAAIALAGNIVEAVATGITNTIRIVVALLRGDLGKAKAIWSSHWESMAAIGAKIWNNIKTLVAGLAGAIIGFAMGLAQGVKGWFQNMYDALVGGSIIPDMVNDILEWIDTLVGSFTGLISGLWGTVKGAFESGRDAIIGFVSGAKDTITGIIQALSDTFTGVVSGLWSIVTGDFEGGKETISTAISDARDAISGHISDLKESVTGTVGELWGGVEEAFNTAKETLTTVAGEIAAAIPDPFRGIISDMIGIGSDILSGVITGIENVKGRLRGMLSGVASDIPGWLKVFLGIGSPAKMLIPVGESITEGIAAGIMKAQPVVRGAIGDVAGATVGSAARGTVINNNNTFNVTGNYRYQSEKRIAQEVKALAMLRGAA